MINMSCPHCGHQLSIDEKYAGQTGACRQCSKPITVPTLSPVVGAEETYEGFTVMDEDHTQPSYSGISDKPKTVIRKKDRAPQPISMGFLIVLGAILVVGGGIVIASFVYANLNEPDRGSEETASGPSAVSPLAGKSIEEVLEYLPTRYPKVAWYEVNGNEIYIGWNDANITGNARRCAEGAAITASQTGPIEVKTFLLDANKAQQGWRPGGPGLIYQSAAQDGVVTLKD